MYTGYHDLRDNEGRERNLRVKSAAHSWLRQYPTTYIVCVRACQLLLTAHNEAGRLLTECVEQDFTRDHRRQSQGTPCRQDRPLTDHGNEGMCCHNIARLRVEREAHRLQYPEHEHAFSTTNVSNCAPGRSIGGRTHR